ncbi:MAG: T9SS type A sorting domain-containing protein [Bacteroidales bacterium]|nr:T9SS type A sorting domain-containing protein [Bacteroidales bacterium]
MNRTTSLFASILICLPGITGLQAQELITPLYRNQRAAQQHVELQSTKKTAAATLLELPVFDDFSNSTLITDTGIWSDSYAYANNHFPVNPVSNGVATLDALDANGSMYDHAVLSPLTFEADHLSSHPINLEYPASDSIYLSFLYQPGGLCDLPEEEDSLMVDFFASDSSRWINVWRAPGAALHPFKTVMIPITAERFLNSNFRFRFRNRASLPRNNETPDKRSNVDYWHVDYVRLHENRSSSDTILRDVAFHTGLSTVFKELSAVPWSHFEKAYNTSLAPFVSAGYRNNDSITRNVTRSLTILEPLYDESELIGTPSALDVPAQEEMLVDFPFPYDLDFQRGDSALVRFEAALRTDEFDPKVNDTVIHDQLFRDYYAYDDGTAEAGYGLRGDGTAYGMVAIRHYSFEPDMLGGIYIFFNQVYDSVNLKEYPFNLMVWNDSDGMPGTVIWDDEVNHKPKYTPAYNGFVKYEFTDPVPVNGLFYVGWRQEKEYILNVGLDLNNPPAAPVMFYNQGAWAGSEAPGMLLFRPFMYDRSTGMESPSKKAKTALNLYPNPASDRIWIQLPAYKPGDPVLVDIYDSSGRQVHRSELQSNSLDVSGFSPGLYHIRVIISGEPYYSKVLINR